MNAISHGAMVLVLLSAALCADAQTPPSSIPVTRISVEAEGTAGPSEISTYGSLSNSAVNGGSEGGSESSMASASAEFSVAASGSTSGGASVPNSLAQGMITVFYKITGPANTQIPLLISGSASTSAAGPDAEGTAYIEYNDGALYTCSSTIAGPCGSEPASGSLSDVRFTNQGTNTLYDMQVIASGDSTGGSGSFSAHISCITLIIDPAFLATNPGYKIVFGANAEAAVCSPTISPEVAGTLGTNGWYISRPTTLKWAVTGKPAPTKSGCATVSVPDTMGTTYTCTATNEVGSASDSITIKKDTVLPKVSIKKPASNLTYTLGHKVPASYSCTDATSSVASCTGTVPDGADINTATSGLQSFSVVATDNAGNTTTKTVNYMVN